MKFQNEKHIINAVFKSQMLVNADGGNGDSMLYTGTLKNQGSIGKELVYRTKIPRILTLYPSPQ